MSVKMTFWFAAVALAAMGSAVVAVPLSTVNADDSAPGKDMVKPSETIAPSAAQDKIERFETPDAPAVSDLVITEPSEQQQPAQAEEAVTGSDAPTAVTGGQPTNPADDVELFTAPNSPADPTKSAGPTRGQKPPRPSSPAGGPGVHAVNMGPAIPFFLEFFQPFQPFPGQSNQQPFKHQQLQPFGASVDPFDPFVNPSRISSFDQLVSAYTNEFRNMLASIDKGMQQMDNVDSKQGVPNKPVGKTTTRTEIIDGHVVQINETTYSNGDDNHKAFYHFKEIQVLPEKPNTKIVSNEKIASTANDDSGTKNEETNEIKRINGEASPGAAVPADDTKHNLVKKGSEPKALDDHFQTAAATYYAPYAPYGPHPALYFPRPALYYGRPHPNFMPANPGRPYPPTGPANYNQHPANYNQHPANYNQHPANSNQQPANYNRPQANYNRPPAQAPISLQGDTYVNELAAMQQQASGTVASLPPDVEFINVNGKPQNGGQYFYNNPQHTGPSKFSGRKN